MASSTTKPSASVNARRLTLSSEKPNIAMPAKVPMMDKGRARAGMNVARQVRRKARMTRITRHAVRISVSCTSCTASRIEIDRSLNTLSLTVGGSSRWNSGSALLMASVTATVLASGWRWTERMIERVPLNSARASSFSTESSTLAMSCSRTGAPLRHVTISGLKKAAVGSAPLTSRI